MMEVAIQGIKGSFHEIAAFKYFGEREPIQTVECDSFPMVFRSFTHNKHCYGIMAIENTVAGTILPNYALLRNSDMRIIGEVYLRIQHNLLALQGQRIADLTEVRSHPMALLQCQAFFEQHPHIKLVSCADTAESAKILKDKQLTQVGAIASSLAAEYYQLSTLAESIETNKRNFTRFLVLQHKDTLISPSRTPNKSSICFHLSHRVGSLAEVLKSLSDNGINLTKIQSLPIVGQVWEYFFHLDLQFSEYDTYQKALQDIQPYIKELQILGEYREGVKHRNI